MGALTRATRNEIDELAAGDPSWWPGILGRVAEFGVLALRDEASARGWAWSATWAWVVGDAERFDRFEEALRACALLMGWETMQIADGVNEDKAAVAKATLRVNTRFKLAGKVDKERWGDKVQVEQAGPAWDTGLADFAVALLDRVGGRERVVEAVGHDVALLSQGLEEEQDEI